MEDFREKLPDRFLYIPKPSSQANHLLTVNSDLLVMHLGPGKNYSMVGNALLIGKKLNAIAEDQSCIKMEATITGWAKKEFVKEESISPINY